MAGLHQLLLTSCILFSVATLTTAVPFDRQGLSSNLYTKKNVSSDSENVCMIDDVLYQVGDAIPTASPCEKCVCRPPGFACSIITCEKRPNCRALQRSNQCCPEYKCDCEHNGKVYHNGEKLDNTQNPCKVCFCQGGEIACTVIECYKRDDCVPKHVPGMCCPKYDNCPPRDPARTVSSSFSPPVQPTNSTEAREAPKFREVADDRLNLLGEPEATNQPLPEQPISNNIYALPQGDDPQAYEVYDDSSTSTSTTGFIIYDDGLTSSTTPNYDSSEENSSYISSSNSTTDGSTPWTGFPTFPEELLTLGPDEWSHSTSSSSQDGSTELILTWGDYSASTSTSTQNTGALSSSTSTQSTSTSTDDIAWTFEIGETSTTSTLSTSTLSSSPQSSHPTDDTTSSSTSTFSTQDLFVSGSTDSSTVETATSSTDETSTSTTLDVSSPTTSTLSTLSFITGSGDGESYVRTSNCIDGSEDYDSSVDFMNSTDSDSSISLEETTDTSLDAGTTTSDQTTGTTEQEYSSTSDTEVSSQDVTASQEMSSGSTDFSTNTRTSELNYTGIMVADMAQPEQEASTILTDIWNSGDQSMTQSNTTNLPDATDLKSNKSMESIKVGPSDANGSMYDSSTLNDDSSSTATTDSSSTATTDSSSTATTDSSSTATTDSSSTATTESSTHSSTRGEYETSTTSVDYGSSSGHTDTEMTTESTISTVVTDTETPMSSSSETSTTQASETNTQSTETETDSTTTEMSS